MKTIDIITYLHEGEFSCIVQHGEEIRTYSRRGVIDLYELYKSEPTFMQGAFVADKVIGKGAAALLVLGRVKEVYADVISTPALDLLNHANIIVHFDKLVPFIINRKKDGRCPLETACDGIDIVQAIYPVIQDFVRKVFYTDKV